MAEPRIDFFADPAEEAAPRPTHRPSRRSETFARVAWAAPWIVFAIAIIVIGEAPFAIAMAGLAAIGCAELFRMTAKAKPFAPVAFIVVVGLILGAMGFGGLGGAFVGIAKFLFFVAIAMFVIFLILGLVAAKKVG